MFLKQKANLETISIDKEAAEILAGTVNLIEQNTRERTKATGGEHGGDSGHSGY